MRFFEGRRCKSAWWKAVFFLGLLLVGLYVIFDILDLDGSEMKGWLKKDIIVTTLLDQSETERFWRVDLASPGSTVLGPPSLSRLLLAAVYRSSPAPAILCIRQSRLLARNMHREPTHASSPAADPA